MKKLLSLLLVLMMTVTLFTACSLPEIIKSEEIKADEKFDKVLDACKNQDANALKSLFSKNAINADENIDEDIARIFSIFQGEFVKYDGGKTSSDGKKYDDFVLILVKSSYDVETTEGNYRFAIADIFEDTSDKNNIGINSLYMVKAENSDTEFTYFGDGKWTPGINIMKNDSEYLQKGMERDLAAHINTNYPFQSDKYIYYFDDPYFENGQYSFGGVRYKSLYRLNTTNHWRQLVYSGENIGIFSYGNNSILSSCIYVIDNVNNKKTPKITMIALEKSLAQTPRFEDVLNDETTDIGDNCSNLKIYKWGLFYLKKNGDNKDLYYTSFGKTELVQENVAEYYLVGNRLAIYDKNGDDVYCSADVPYEKTDSFMYDLERPIPLDSTGKFIVSFESSVEDETKADMYKENIYNGERTLLKTGYISNCEIVNDTILYTEFIDGVGKVYIMNLDGNNINQLSE